jgi:proteasome assembly chaperone 4
MKDSLLLWIGDRASMTDLAVAMPTRFNAVPITTKLIGPTDNLTSSQLAQRLAKRTGKQCFLSYNLPNLPGTSQELIEQRLMEEMTTLPNCF